MKDYLTIKMKTKLFEFADGKEKKTIRVRVCDNLASKFSGLMFRSHSLPLLFVFRKETNIIIHSFFCRKFLGIWLDEKRKVVKKEIVRPWRFSISGRGKYLLEVLL